MERYNKYGESLYVDCNCKEKTETKKSSNCSCGGINLPSHDNQIDILINQLKREVNELMKNTNARLLCQDKKIAETMVYIKNNLSNYLRDMLNAMKLSGKLDEIIESIITLYESPIYYKINPTVTVNENTVTYDFTNAIDPNETGTILVNGKIGGASDSCNISANILYATSYSLTLNNYAGTNLSSVTVSNKKLIVTCLYTPTTDITNMRFAFSK